MRNKKQTLLCLASLFSGCNLFTLLADAGPASEIPPGQRLVIGELLIPREDDFGGAANQGMTLAALSGDPLNEVNVLHVGVPFNPSQTNAVGGEKVQFQLLLPSDKSAVLFFQTTPASGSGNRFGRYLASLSFATDATGDTQSAILPAGEAIVDLGLVRIEANNIATNQDNIALPEENPLAQVDSDNDGTPDLNDNDDDGDGIPDVEDLFDANLLNEGVSDDELASILVSLAGE
jgi:hypothetical protein